MIETGTLLSERYEIKERIGSGGMADVYRAVDTRLNRLIAVKVLKSEFSNDKSFISRFKNEAKSAAGLSHPNIVSVYDVGDDKGFHYIVMELVEGITLKKFIEKKGRLEVREAVGISIQIAQGMEAAHEHGIIHRDIKPQNIMISRDGKVKVADFGIAKVVSSDTYTQNAVGSVHYLSPEQARGGYYDERSDIYSLGVTLYEMLTGQLPFGGESDVSVALKHIQLEARPARELVPSIPYSLDKVVQKCMQKHPENRYSSASDLIIDLKHSITNPDGDFVRINSGVEGRTRTFTNAETSEIQNQAAAAPVQQPVYNDNYVRQQNQYNNGKVLREEFEELDTIDSKFEKVIIVITIIAAIGLVIFAAFLCIRFFGGSGNGSGNTTPTPGIGAQVSTTPVPTQVATISMPNLFGYTKEDAENFMYAKSPNFTIIYEDAEYSTQDEGTVIRQYPVANADVLVNQTIKLTLSAGGEPITIPRLIGLSQAAATSQLEAMGFEVIPQFRRSDSIVAGQVISTEPKVGTIAHAGDSIMLYVSLGEPDEYTNVPDVLTKNEQVAKELLENAGLKLGEVTYDYSTTVAYGCVIKQSVAADKTIVVGTQIDVVLSMGPMPADITPSPAPGYGRSYYSVVYDTTVMRNPCNIFFTDPYNLFFEIAQGDYSSIIYVDYDNTSADEQVYKVNYSTFPRVYSFKLYIEFANGDVDYGQLTPGEAYVTAYLDGQDIGTQVVNLEVNED